MIDTLIFSIYGNAGRCWRDNVPAENVRQTGADSYTGKIGNLKVRENVDGVTVAGSIPKYLNGENVSKISLTEFTQALRKLEDDTGMNLNEAILRRVDFGHTMLMDKPAGEYLKLFGEYPRYRRSVCSDDKNYITGVMYYTNTGSVAYCAYDKNAEMEGKPLPELYDKMPLLRQEYRIINRAGIKAKLGNGHDVTPWGVASKAAWKELAKQYYAFYKGILKYGREVFFDTSKEITPKLWFDVLGETFRQSNPDEYHAFLSSCRARGLLSKKSIERIRKIEKEKNRDFVNGDTSPLIEFLDEWMYYQTTKLPW